MIPWQDAVFTGGSLIFTIGLLPQLYDCIKGSTINILTGVVTSSVLFIFCMTYATLGLWFSAIPFTACAWALITITSYRNGRLQRKQL